MQPKIASAIPLKNLGTKAQMKKIAAGQKTQFALIDGHNLSLTSVRENISFPRDWIIEAKKIIQQRQGHVIINLSISMLIKALKYQCLLANPGHTLIILDIYHGFKNISQDVHMGAYTNPPTRTIFVNLFQSGWYHPFALIDSSQCDYLSITIQVV